VSLQVDWRKQIPRSRSFSLNKAIPIEIIPSLLPPLSSFPICCRGALHLTLPWRVPAILSPGETSLYTQDGFSGEEVVLISWHIRGPVRVTLMLGKWKDGRSVMFCLFSQKYRPSFLVSDVDDGSLRRIMSNPGWKHMDMKDLSMFLMEEQ